MKSKVLSKRRKNLLWSEWRGERRRRSVWQIKPLFLDAGAYRSQMMILVVRLKELGFKTYADYLASDHWSRFRSSFFSRHQPLCPCNKQPATDLHHRNYNRLGREYRRDCIPVCRDCHTRIHDMLRQNPRASLLTALAKSANFRPPARSPASSVAPGVPRGHIPGVTHGVKPPTIGSSGSTTDRARIATAMPADCSVKNGTRQAEYPQEIAVAGIG